MYARKGTFYRLSANHHSRTYTIRKYVDCRCVEKYRSTPRGELFSDNWSEEDIIKFMQAHSACLTRCK